MTCRSGKVDRRTVAVDDAEEFGRRRFDWPIETADLDWVRVEFWDIADDGAFTQPFGRKP